ncbi:MAG: deoxyuridine 5'-triphosphate nucleotidohydrolase [Ruminococcus sp.]|nr:deoxyuridine 5'-triphosphate nucleotidohydrolase [Ruminococcus sp.]
MKIRLLDFGVPEDRRPFRPHDNDAGADVYMPYECTVKPGEIIKIPLGFGIEVPDGFAGFVFPRSSMAVKGLVCELPPVDSGYRGEIHAIISNVSNKEHTIRKDDRIGQLVIMPVIIADFVSEHSSQRGLGGFGSTGE